MQQTKSLRKGVLDILDKVQILYQNNQIDNVTKDEITNLVKLSLSNDKFVKELSVKLENTKRIVDVNFRDIVLECLVIIE